MLLDLGARYSVAIQSVACDVEEESSAGMPVLLEYTR